MRDAGANGCTIVGVLGESNRLTDKEREQLITTAMNVSKEGMFNRCGETQHRVLGAVHRARECIVFFLNTPI